MPIQQSTTGATAGNLTRYGTQYQDTVAESRTYDQLASKVPATFEPRGPTVSYSWATKLTPRPTAAQGVEYADFDPQTFRDVSRTMNLIWVADGVKAHELVRLKSSLDPMGQITGLVSQLASETIDGYARQVATQGSLVIYGDMGHSSRITLDLGTPGDRFNLDRFTEVKSMLGAWGRGGGLMAIITDFQYADLISTNSTILTTRQGYTEEGTDMLYNYQLAKLAGVNVVVSPFAKRFYGAGADNSSAVATTLAASVTTPTANTAGSQIIEVASATNISGSKWLTIGTVQTSTESDATIVTEIVRVAGIGTGILVNGAAVTGATATSVLIVGSGPAGGLMYDHSVGAAVENGDTVHCAVFGTPKSLAVEFQEYGRYGKLVPKFEDGNAKQWTTASFKYWGNFGRMDESRLVRVETSASGQ
jgi:hypothetical protein